MIAALGSAFPVPTMSGAEPCTGSNRDGSGAGGVEVRRGRPPDAAGHRAGEVGEDVAEQVVGDDDVVATGVRDEMDARRVDVVVRGLDIGVLGCDGIERALPEVAREGEHVRLVHQREMVTVAGAGEVEREAHAALDTEAGVDRTLCRDLVGRSVAEEPAFARVDPFGVLADHGEVDAVVERGSDRARNGRRFT